MAEPRVGVLMDLGRIRSRLPAIIAATGDPADPDPNAATSSSSSALPSHTPPASVPWAQLASLTGLFAPTVEELGAHRQEEEDCLATVLVQVLGMKGGEEINDGFKAHVLPLLPGGAEAHRESEGRAGRNGEKREAGRNGGRREGKGDGGAGNSGEWSQGLEGPVWDRYVGGMACLLAHDGRDEMRAPKAASSINSDPNGSLSIRISKNFISSGIPKGMFVSGIDATGFALAVAAILSKPQFSEDACRVFFTDANNEYRVKLENSATEAARKKHAGAINLVALFASFAYRPVSTLIHCFLFLFPPDQTREAYSLLGLFMPSGQEETVNWRHVRGRLEGFAEEQEMAMFMHACSIIASRWAKEEEPNPGRFARLVEEEGAGQEKGGLGKWKQLDSEMWEEVRMWRHAAKAAWPGDRRNWMGELRDKCMGRRKRTKHRCSEDEEEGGGEEKEEEGLVYAKKWVGGVNLLACLKAMLLGEPWKGCHSAAAAAAAATDLEKGKMEAANQAAGNKAGGSAAESEEPGTPAGTFWTDASGVDTRAERLKSGYRRVCQGPRCSCVEWDGVELKMCRRCGSEAYCSKACQKAAWPSHKLTCRPKEQGK
ncbi:unnamed protein product [Closterium sp. NIES-65]|nr:unnamed protein product [Closterium sp. NIES-65]